jgi:hypothetical protein
MSDSIADGAGIAMFVRPVCADVYTKQGRTPLQTAVANGHVNVSS